MGRRAMRWRPGAGASANAGASAGATAARAAAGEGGPRVVPSGWRPRRAHPRAPIARLLGLLAALLLTACAHLPPPAAVDCAMVAAQIDAATTAWVGRGIAGTVELTARHGLARQRANAALLLSPPDRLHAELLDPLGTAQAVAIVDSATARTATWSADLGWRRDTAIGPLPATLLVYLPRLLLGIPPPAAACVPGAASPLLVWRDSAEYRWDPHQRRLLEARLAGITVRYLPPEPAGAGSDASGTPRLPDLDITLSDGATVALRWRQRHLDPNLDPTLFTVPSPPEKMP